MAPLPRGMSALGLLTLERMAELELGTITVDTTDARALAGWWAQVLDGSVDDFPEAGIHVVRTHRLKGLNLAFQQTTRPNVGFSALIPQHCAGWRSDRRPSLPFPRESSQSR
jgi:hypothetical protein